MTVSLMEDLRWRDLIADCTDAEGLEKRLTEKPLTLYCGFDPTSDSLHVGNLMGQVMLRRFQLAGHHPVPLAGGATGMIGDPSGKSSERNLLTREQLDHNVASIKKQLHKLLDFDGGTNPARLVDNADWTRGVSYLDFLRDVGKHFSVNMMVNKESVKARMQGETGLSYTEFSYMLLQAFDFFHLRKELQCELQVGGSDQWGNIVAGTELIRKKLQASCFGLTFPLITKSDGTKFGKSESGAVYLDPNKTSPYRFYQFFINTEDTMVISYLKKFTFLSHAEIDALAAQHAQNAGARDAHRALAREVTTLVHGKQTADDAVRASDIMFGGSLDGVSQATLTDVVGELPSKDVTKDVLGAGMPLTDALVLAGLAQSKGAARRDIEGGGVYINNVKQTDVARAVTSQDTLFGTYVLLRKGKKSYAVLRTT